MPQLRHCVFVLLALTAATSPAAAPDPAALEFFEKKVRPLLVDNCYNCHSANTNAKGGLRVDDRGGLLTGGSSGPAVVPGNPAKSLLINAVAYTDDNLLMPPKKQLSAEQVAVLTKWVEDGAVWPKIDHPVAGAGSNERYDRLRKQHWAWQPLKVTAPPQVKNAAWPRSDVDRFVAAKLEEKNLTPVGDADRTALIRRVTFDLTGLPPSPGDIDAFVNDRSPDAYAELVDRLLASPAFGERWGGHWLDVARFGESTGSSRNVPYPHAWRYRDYVIGAFNADKPFDQFVREQVAGDLLPAGSAEQKDAQTIATGFLALGVKDVNQRFKVRFTMDNVDEQIDTVTRSVLGVTASCARCHDHKFDPVPATDYYALAGIFTSTDLCAGVRNKMGGGGLDYYDTAMLIPLAAGATADKPAADPKKIEQLRADHQAALAEFNKIRGTPAGLAKGPDGFPKQRAFRQRMEKLRTELMALTDPAASGQPVALGVRDAKAVGDTELRVRGEAEQLGPVVPRGFLSLIDVPGAPKVNEKQSGRLELAQWLTHPNNPLTPRVIVNRAWQHLFGQGIVTSVDNFGVTGDVPSHPELLDHLAAGFVKDGWSVKRLVRSLVLTRAYRLSSEASPANLTVDPADRLVWRHAPRRLSAEEIRDATLAASGTLAPDRPEASVAQALPVREIRNNGPEARRFAEFAQDAVHRSVYLPLLRGLTPTSLEVFDFAEQGMVTGSRDATTVATQALYLLNDPFVRKQSLALAERVLARKDLGETSRLDLAYRLTLGRSPTPQEIDRAKDFLSDFESAARDTVAHVPAPAQVAAAVTPADTDSATTGAPRKPAPPIDPDEVPTPDEPVKEVTIQANNPKTAAWAALAQALYGSAEFRYLK
jgi:hypothetical protein